MWGGPLRKNTRKESDEAPFFSPASGAPNLFLPLASSFFHSILSHPPPSSPNPHHPPHRHRCIATTPIHPPFIHSRLKHHFLQPSYFSAMPQSSKRKSIIIRVPTSPVSLFPGPQIQARPQSLRFLHPFLHLFQSIKVQSTEPQLIIPP